LGVNEWNELIIIEVLLCDVTFVQPFPSQ